MFTSMQRELWTIDQRQLRMNIRNAYLVADLATLDRAMHSRIMLKRSRFEISCFQELIDELIDESVLTSHNLRK